MDAYDQEQADKHILHVLTLDDPKSWPTVTTGLPDGVDDEQVKDWLEDYVRESIEQDQRLDWDDITDDFELGFKVDLGNSMQSATIKHLHKLARQVRKELLA